MFFNTCISEIQRAKTLSKINDILVISCDKLNGLSREQVAKIQAEADKQKQKLYASRYIMK